MKRIRTGQTKRILTAGAIALTFAAAGLGLLGYSLFGGSEPASAETPEKAAPSVSRSIPEKIFTSISRQFQAPRAEAPKDPAMKLTVPEMERVENVPVYDTAPKGYEKALRDGTVHVKGTGFPWQDEANVYIAGHRLGYPNTPSFLAFWDIDNVVEGDQVFVEDANGREYTYEVFQILDVEPTDLFVTEPLEGRNIVTLQTCTLPDYARRLVVQAELVDTKA
ncbi:MAG: sortase [Rubrobacter sp.]|nr:sortase [Rubrobacter sp.]